MPADFDLLAQFVDLGLLRVVLAQLALDGLELLAQDVLALGLVHLRLDFGLDAALELEDLDLVGEERADQLEALDDVDRLEQFLALFGGHVGAVRDHVGQQARLADVARGDGGFRRDRRAVGDVLLDLGLDGAHHGLDLDAVGRLVRQLFDGRRQVRLGRREAVHAQAALALDDGPDGAVLELDDLGDLGQRADGVQLGRVVDVFLVGLALGDEGDGTAVGDRGVERVDALVATHLERDDHLREDDGLAERHERKLTGSGDLVGWIERIGLRFDRGGRSLGHQEFSYGAGCRRTLGAGTGIGIGGGVGRRLGLGRVGGRGGGRGLGTAVAARRFGLTGPFGIERLEDPRAEALLEFEQDPDPGEVHAALAGEMPDPGDAADVVLAVEPDVGRGTGRAEQPFVLVDPKGARMRADQRGRHADDVDGPLRVSFWSSERHAQASVGRGRFMTRILEP